jgi:hypothetical protein
MVLNMDWLIENWGLLYDVLGVVGGAVIGFLAGLRRNRNSS